MCVRLCAWCVWLAIFYGCRQLGCSYWHYWVMVSSSVFSLFVSAQIEHLSGFLLVLLMLLVIVTNSAMTLLALHHLSVFSF